LESINQKKVGEMPETKDYVEEDEDFF